MALTLSPSMSQGTLTYTPCETSNISQSDLISDEAGKVAEAILNSVEENSDVSNVSNESNDSNESIEPSEMEEMERKLRRERDAIRFRELWNKNANELNMVDNMEINEMILNNKDYWDDPPAYEMRDIIDDYKLVIAEGEKREAEIQERKRLREEEAKKKAEEQKKAKEAEELRKKQMAIVPVINSGRFTVSDAPYRCDTSAVDNTLDTGLDVGIDMEGADLTEYFISYLDRYGQEENGDQVKVRRRIEKEILPHMRGSRIDHPELWRFNPEKYGIINQHMVELYKKKGWSTYPLENVMSLAPPVSTCTVPTPIQSSGTVGTISTVGTIGTSNVSTARINANTGKKIVQKSKSDDNLTNSNLFSNSVFGDDDDDDLDVGSLFDNEPPLLAPGNCVSNITSNTTPKSTGCARYVAPPTVPSEPEEEQRHAWENNDYEVDILGIENQTVGRVKEYGINTQMICFQNSCSFDSSSFNGSDVTKSTENQVFKFLTENSYYVSNEVDMESVYIINLVVTRQKKVWKNNKYESEGNPERVYQDSEIFDLAYTTGLCKSHLCQQKIYDFFVEKYAELIQHCCGGLIEVSIEIEYLEENDFLEDAWQYISKQEADGDGESQDGNYDYV